MKRLISAAGLALLALAALPAARSGASPFPAAPAGVHVAAVTHTSFTIALKKSTNASSYRLYVSHTKSDVYVANIKSGNTTSGLHTYSSSTPSLKATPLTYSANAFYYRVAAVNGSNRAFTSTYWSIGLAPSTPTSFHAVDRYLTWAGQSSGFTVQRATDSAMTQNVVSRTIRGQAHQYTPFGLASGTTYWFRGRALNQTTASAWTRAVSMQVTSNEQSTRVMTYNILEKSSDGTLENGNKVSPWAQRKITMAALIKSVNPDVIGIQEANQSFTGSPGLRQVDDLNNAIDDGAAYTVAHTELVYGEAGYDGNLKTGDYILYKSSTYQPFGSGGQFGIGVGRWGVYQPLENIATGARALFVCTHLTAGLTSALDESRLEQTSSLVRQANDIATTLGVPVVYLGDFNSDPDPRQHPVDGPAVVMRNNHIVDARDVALTRTNEKYDSENKYDRTPLAFSTFIDYIWAPPGISVTSWGQALELSGGKYVGTIPSDHNPIYAQVHIPY
jgi:endonuclease/exonuclease/phosphatase family metal-dependent hydrolase